MTVGRLNKKSEAPKGRIRKVNVLLRKFLTYIVAQREKGKGNMQEKC
jgi:hypothetical protein